MSTLWERAKLTKKQLWIIIGVLVLLNILTIVLLMIKSSGSLGSGKEGVATIGKEKVTRQEWLQQMEKEYGEDVLKELIDKKIILQAAKKYKIKIPNKVLDQEITMLKTMYHTNGNNQADEKEWKEQIKLSLLLEELLTKDVIISEAELKEYYEDNKNRYQITPAFHVSHIVVETKQEATQVIKELNDGSSFSVLAMERSIDEFTANEGGEIGFISENDERFPSQYVSELKKLTPGKWSNPIQTSEGYAIIFLHDYIEGKNYSFNEVKSQIRRHMALEQMDMPISTKPYWEELGVDWFYGKK